MVKKNYRRLLSMIAAMVIVLSTILAPVQVSAAEAIDMSKSGKATLTLQLPAASESVKLYQIADYDSESKITMKKEAADLKVTIDSKDSAAALNEKAKTLAAKISGKPTVGKTDSKGAVKFDKLALGYYLVVVDKCESASVKYQVAPTIISVPAVEKSTLKYDVTVKLSYQTPSAATTPATTTPKAPTDNSTGEKLVGAGNDSSGVTTPEIPVTPNSPSPTPADESTTVSPTPADESTTVSPTPADESTTVSPTPKDESTTVSPTPKDESTTVSPTPKDESTAVSPTPKDESTTVSPTPKDESTPVSPTPTDESTTVSPTPADESTPVSPTPADESTPVSPTPADESSISAPTEIPEDESSISGPTVTPADDSSISDPSITPDPNKWQISVTKYWVDKNNIELDKDAITVDSLPIQIWKRADESSEWQKIQLVDLTAKDNWTYSWQADDDGAMWTVSEPVTPIGYTQLTIKQSRNNDKKTLAFKVTNQSNADVTPAPRQLSVVKYWEHKDGTAIDKEEIGVDSLPIRIYRREKAEGAAWRLFDTIKLTEKDNWEYHWGAADDGADWTVTERDVPEGYELVEPITLAHNKEWTKIQFRITNHPKDEPDPTVTVTPTTDPDITETVTPTTVPATVTPTIPAGKKQISVVMYWKDTDGVTDLDATKVSPESVAVKVYKKPTSTGKWEVYKDITLTKKDNWSSFLLVDEDDSSWTVTETVPGGFEKVSIMQSGGSGKIITFKITNKKVQGNPTTSPTDAPTTRTLVVTKKWLNTSGQEMSSSQIGVSSLTVNLYKKAPGETKYSQVDTIELLPSKNWTYSWVEPNDGSTWTVTEPNVPSGYTRKSITTSQKDDQLTQLFTITNQKTTKSTPTPTPKGRSATNSPTRKVTATPTAKVTGKSKGSPRTGDTQNIWIPFVTFVGAAVVLILLGRKRVR